MQSRLGHFPKILRGPAGSHAAPGGALQEAGLDQVGLVDVFQGVFFFAKGRGQGAQTHRPAVILLQDGEQDLPVDAVQAQLVDVQEGEGGVGGGLIDAAVALNLGVVPHPFQQPVGNAGGAPGAPGDFPGAVRLDVDLQHPGGPADDVGQVLHP